MTSVTVSVLAAGPDHFSNMAILQSSEVTKYTCITQGSRGYYEYNRETKVFSTEDSNFDNVRKMMGAFKDNQMTIDERSMSLLMVRLKTVRAEEASSDLFVGIATVSKIAVDIMCQLYDMKRNDELQGKSDLVRFASGEDRGIFYTYITSRNILVTNDKTEQNRTLCKKILEKEGFTVTEVRQ